MPSFIWKFGCRDYCEPFFWLVVYLKLLKEDSIFDFNLWSSALFKKLCAEMSWASHQIAAKLCSFFSALTQLITFAHLRTETVNNIVSYKKSEWKGKEIGGIFGKFQMAASVRILRISASYSTQRLFRMSDWIISGLILKIW